MKHIVIYVHGKGGSAEEAEHYRALFPGAEVIGFDYCAQTPWEAKQEFPAFFRAQKARCERLSLIANSLGAFFSLSALSQELVDAAYLSCPVVAGVRLSGILMQWAGVTEQELAEKQEIPTQFGETLSMQYLRYVREHPIVWHVPTRILYGEHDNLTSMQTISAFAGKTGAALTVMPGGEHGFHTEAQMQVMDRWLQTRPDAKG